MRQPNLKYCYKLANCGSTRLNCGLCIKRKQTGEQSQRHGIGVTIRFGETKISGLVLKMKRILSKIGKKGHRKSHK